MKKHNKNRNINDTFIIGMIAALQNKQARVWADGKMLSCILPGSTISRGTSLAVGDKVRILPAGGGQYRLEEILPRATEVFRENRRSPGESILIAANAEYLLTVISAERLVKQEGFLEGAAVAAQRAGIPVGLVISRLDQVGEELCDSLKKKLAWFESQKADIFIGNTKEVHDHLLKSVKGKIVLVVGDRSCGKTTLIYQLLGRPSVRVPATSAPCLYAHEDGTLFLDTPGFRDFAFQRLTEDEKGFVFSEITKAAKDCRFHNCTHTCEEGCKVIEAVREGRISRGRVQLYRKMTGGGAKQPKMRAHVDYRHEACTETFVCQVCQTPVAPEGAGTRHRNHCPNCLSSLHVDEMPGDRASLCRGIMDPVSVWVRKDGEWALIHRCRVCGALSSNRVAADDNPYKLLSIAVKPLAQPPFPLDVFSKPES